jgi:hypothetical protein
MKAFLIKVPCTTVDRYVVPAETAEEALRLFQHAESTEGRDFQMVCSPNDSSFGDAAQDWAETDFERAVVVCEVSVTKEFMAGKTAGATA